MLQREVYSEEEVEKLESAVEELKESWIDSVFGEINKLDSD